MSKKLTFTIYYSNVFLAKSNTEPLHKKIMAKIIFEVGDFFSTKDGYGIVIPGDKTLMIIGGGGRLGWRQEIGPIPRDATLSDLKKNVPGEVSLALKSVFLLLAAQSQAAGR